MNDLSEHNRMSLLQRFAPAEVIENSTRPRISERRPREGRFHLWGWMNGAPVDVCISWGGVFTEPRINAASLEAVPDQTVRPDEIVSEVRATLGIST